MKFLNVIKSYVYNNIHINIFVFVLIFMQLTSSVKIESTRVNYCFGQFLSIFVKGWEEKECHRAYFAIIDHQNLVLKIGEYNMGLLHVILI